GLPPDADDVRMVLSDATALTTFEERLGADGAFAFADLPPGTYVPTLTGGVQSGLLNPPVLAVSGEMAGVEMAYPQGSRRMEPQSAAAPLGATVTEVGVLMGLSSSASAAIANLRTVNTAEVTYLSTSGGNYGTISDMIAAGLLDSRFNGTFNNF